MRVHRTEHARHFTVLPNGLLQDRRLSYTARGLLTDLLSRPDGWREDGRQMADSSPQGRGVVRRALKELAEAGYYRVDRVRLPDGTLRSEAHVFDRPQVGPGVDRPGAGQGDAGRADAPLVKNPGKETALPEEPDEEIRAAVATLFRVIRPEPRLRLGEKAARELAPLVARWLERGSTASDLARALLPGLPEPIRSPAGVIRSRLERKMPPAVVPPTPWYVECAKCHDPVPRAGICRACAGLGERPVVVASAPATARSGAAAAREALRAARAGGRLAAAA